MRTLASIFLCLSAAGHSLAAELKLPLTVKTVEYWSLTGARFPEIGQDPLSLPAGAQLQRGFAADRISVELVSRPVFSAAPEDWTVLELGSSALVFAREGNQGALILIVGDAAPEVHLVPGELGDDGRPTDPFSIVLGRHEHGVTLEVAGAKIERRATPEREALVVFSTGSQRAMEIDRAAVTLTVIDGQIPRGLVDEAASAEAAVGRDTKGETGDGTRSNAHKSSSRADAHKESSSPLSRITVYRPLEIATPPSVRGHRTERVEGAVKALNNR